LFCPIAKHNKAHSFENRSWVLKLWMFTGPTAIVSCFDPPGMNTSWPTLPKQGLRPLEFPKAPEASKHFKGKKDINCYFFDFKAIPLL